MFYLNPSYKKATLTVKNGRMSVLVPLAGTGIDKIYVGSPSGARKKGAKYCKRKTVKGKLPKSEKTGKIYAFTIPVKKLNEEFTVSIHGKQSGRWYQHQIKITY